MAKRSKRIRKQAMRSRLQQKLMDTNQLKFQEDNSVMIEEVKKTTPPVKMSATTTAPARPMAIVEEVTDERIEEMSEEIEAMLEEMTTQVIEPLSFPETIINPPNLMKLKKTELITMAKTMGCIVSSKNTKRQIIAAIEKQSA